MESSSAGSLTSALVTSSSGRDAGVVRGHERAVDEPGPRFRVGGSHHDHQLVRVRDDGAFDRVGVVGAAAQERLAVLDLHQPGQGVRLTGDVPDERDEVAGHHGIAAQFPGAGGDDLAFLPGALADDGRVASAVHGDDPAGDGVLVGGTVLGARPRALFVGPDPDVGFVPGVSAAGHGWGPLCQRGPRGLSSAALGEHRFPQQGEVRHGLGGGRDVLDLDAGHGQAQDGACRGHAVVRVAVDDAGVERGGPDDQAVAGFLGVAAEPVDLGHEGGQPVRFVPPEVGDAGQPRGSRGERAERRDGRGEFAGFIEVAAGDLGAAGHGERAVLEGDGGAHVW